MRYLILDHYFKGTYMTNDLAKEDLILKKDNRIKMIIDMTNKTFFDPEKNSWEEIPVIS